MAQLILLRHGKSVWNQDKRFTGWTDIKLAPQGIQEAESAGYLLKELGFKLDICFTSELKRSIETLQIVLSIMKLQDIPVRRNWHLNERHYGALEGIGRWAAIKQFGIWPVVGCQLKFNASPPPLDPKDKRFPGNQSRYSDIDKKELPLAESLQQTRLRMQTYWEQAIVPEIQKGKNILIVSHKNILRTLIMQLDEISETHIMKLSIATGRPLIYELDNKLRSIKKYYADAFSNQ